MSILTRFTRLCKADIHGVMDQLEDKELMVKQCLREMAESLARKQAELEKTMRALARNRQDREQFLREREKLEQDLGAAIEKENDDIARLLIKKLKTLDRHLEVMDRHGEGLDRQMASLRELIDTRNHQHAELKLRAETRFQQTEHRKWERTVSPIMPIEALAPMSPEEVELELIKRKEILGKGN